jgi:hypothetical protein
VTARLPDLKEDWAEYERRKAEWVRLHPEATPEAYTAAMRAIADELGV